MERVFSLVDQFLSIETSLRALTSPRHYVMPEPGKTDTELETQGAKSTSVLARSEKWIIPRNALVDTLLAFNIFGQETIFSWIPESFLRIFFYRDLDDLAPPSEGLFTETPMVNSDIFRKISLLTHHFPIHHVSGAGDLFRLQSLVFGFCNHRKRRTLNPIPFRPDPCRQG